VELKKCTLEECPGNCFQYKTGLKVSLSGLMKKSDDSNVGTMDILIRGKKKTKLQTKTPRGGKQDRRLAGTGDTREHRQ